MIPNWIMTLPWDHIRQAAVEHNVPWKLLGAIVMTESGGNTHAVRYEAKYSYLYHTQAYAINNNISQLTEETCQKMSWGLGQVMGANAREHGFQGPLPRLCEPELGLKYSALYIKKLAVKYHTPEDIIAAYNAGSVVKTPGGNYQNQNYVNKVSSYLRDLDLLLK